MACVCFLLPRFPASLQGFEYRDNSPLETYYLANRPLPEVLLWLAVFLKLVGSSNANSIYKQLKDEPAVLVPKFHILNLPVVGGGA